MNQPLGHLHDPLNYLPRRPLTRFAKGSVIYSGDCEALYLVASGRVKVTFQASGERESMMRVVRPQGLFGECVFVENVGGSRAVALDEVQLMAWKRMEVEEQIEQEPLLGLALIEHLLLIMSEVKERLQAMASCKTQERVMFSMLRLARALGERQPDGSLKMAALTQQVLSEYVGSTREIVTTQMNRLRRLGMIRYSRRYIEVYPEAIESALRRGGILGRAGRGAAQNSRRVVSNSQAAGRLVRQLRVIDREGKEFVDELPLGESRRISLAASESCAGLRFPSARYT